MEVKRIKINQSMLWIYVIFCQLLIAKLARADRNPYHIHDYKNHPCNRECKEGQAPKTCRYYFLMEHFVTMSGACHDCPRNISSCYLSQCVAADGMERGILTVNRMIPGPSINVCKGDRVQVMVDNNMQLGEGTSIHWHGLRQLTTPYMDGTNLVTQCPIDTWSKMTYSYLAEDHGTHFWHSHSSLQRADGLYGALVIRQPKSEDLHGELFDFDLPEHQIVLSDWMKRPAPEMMARDYHGGIVAVPSSILINGIGQAKSKTKMPVSVFTVSPGKRYRFRVIYSGILDCPLYMTVDDHQLMVITTDGREFNPVVVDAIFLFSGERYDFVISGKDGPPKNYWMRFRGHGRCHDGKIMQSSILRYEGAPDSEPEGPKPTYDNTLESGLILNDMDGESLQISSLRATEDDTDPDLLTADPDKQIFLAVGTGTAENPQFELPTEEPDRKHLGQKNVSKENLRPITMQFDHISCKLPPSPPLSQYNDIPEEYFCNASTVNRDCRKEFCSCVHRLQFGHGEIVELVLVSYTLGTTHPIHMHGHQFRVVSQMKISPPTVKHAKELDNAGKIPRVRKKAPMKDTIPVHTKGVTVLRFRAINPGFWFFHCHIEFHTETGMAIILQIGNPEDMPPKPEGFPKCSDWKIKWPTQSKTFPKTNIHNDNNTVDSKIEVNYHSQQNVEQNNFSLSLENLSVTDGNQSLLETNTGNATGSSSGLAIGDIIIAVFAVALVLIVLIVAVVSVRTNLTKNKKNYVLVRRVRKSEQGIYQRLIGDDYENTEQYQEN